MMISKLGELHQLIKQLPQTFHAPLQVLAEPIQMDKAVEQVKAVTNAILASESQLELLQQENAWLQQQLDQISHSVVENLKITIIDRASAWDAQTRFGQAWFCQLPFSETILITIAQTLLDLTTPFYQANPFWLKIGNGDFTDLEIPPSFITQPKLELRDRNSA